MGDKTHEERITHHLRWLLIVAAALLPACARQERDRAVSGSTRTGPPTTQRVFTAEERRAVDIARAHVAAANGGRTYGEEVYDPRREGDGWAVHAERYPQVPGGHWLVLIDRDGQVVGYHRGR